MDLDDRIASLAATLDERRRLGPRRAGLAAAITKLSGEMDELRRRFAAEQRDVDRLEDFTMTRVVTTVTGSHSRDLVREHAEAEAAGQRLAEGQRRLDELQEQLAQLTVRLAATDTAPEAYTAALAEKERLLREARSGPGDRLEELAEEHGMAESELHRLERAAKAAARAAEALREAGELLGSARNWSDYDTFLGGGAMSSHTKSERLDEAAAYLSGAERQLRVLRAELGGAEITLPEVRIDGTARVFDVFLDNLVTDMSVRGRIEDGHQHVGRATGHVREVRAALGARIGELRALLKRIEAEREGLLGT